jgi:acyl-CoA thioesterase FadM
MMKLLKSILWGNSVALAWTWGIGLFFSVQIAIQFGFYALLAFASINALGLALFGVINNSIAQKYSNPESFEEAFLTKAKNFKFPLLFYQFLAVTLTIFACLKYVSLPLGVLSILVCIMFIGAVIFLGEEFSIKTIKFSHAIFGISVLAALLYLFNSKIIFPGPELLRPEFFNSYAELPQSGFIFKAAFWIPVIIGFLFGPWLDLQHWQRAIEIHKEKLSIASSYIWGAIIFWLIIMADGILALACFNLNISSSESILNSITNINSSSLLFSFKSSITQVLHSSRELHYLLSAYVIFVFIAALTTLDSAYIAFKWYAGKLMKDSRSLILTIIPEKFISSPIPWLFLCIVTATTTLHFSEFGKFISKFDESLEKFFRFELEYYMAFYASFFIMYAVTFIRTMSDAKSIKSFSALKLFSTGLFSISVFGIGYFIENTLVMALGSLVPVLYGIFTLAKYISLEKVDEQIKSSLKSISEKLPEPLKNVKFLQENLSEQSPEASLIPSSNYQLPANAKASKVQGCYYQDGWFVHSFIPTYQDTNSVGNVYFAMYAMWIGKTRELFFTEIIPDFDPKTSEYLILTRSFEHKFLREVREFDPVTIHVRIGDYNRKFGTLEHKIVDEHGNIIGKGKQSLMFVSTHDYSLIDMPAQVIQGFGPYVIS